MPMVRRGGNHRINILVLEDALEISNCLWGSSLDVFHKLYCVWELSAIHIADVGNFNVRPGGKQLRQESSSASHSHHPHDNLVARSSRFRCRL